MFARKQPSTRNAESLSKLYQANFSHFPLFVRFPCFLPLSPPVFSEGLPLLCCGCTLDGTSCPFPRPVGKEALMFTYASQHLASLAYPPPPLSFPTPGKTVPHHSLGDGHQVTVPHPRQGGGEGTRGFGGHGPLWAPASNPSPSGPEWCMTVVHHQYTTAQWSTNVLPLCTPSLSLP